MTTNPTTVWTSRFRFALYGVLAALAGSGIGHLAAGLTEPAASPVLAVGELVIDHTPTPVKNWAIAHFGSHDKTILVGSVLVGVLLLAAVAGLLARRALRWGAALLLVLVAVALYAALSRPVVHATDALPGIAPGMPSCSKDWRALPQLSLRLCWNFWVAAAQSDGSECIFVSCHPLNTG